MKNPSYVNFAKTVVLGYFLTLINNIGSRNLKQIVVTLQKVSNQKWDKFPKNWGKKSSTLLLRPFAGSQQFFEMSNPDIIDQRQKYHSTTVFIKI